MNDSSSQVQAHLASILIPIISCFEDQVKIPYFESLWDFILYRNLEYAIMHVNLATM